MELTRKFKEVSSSLARAPTQGVYTVQGIFGILSAAMARLDTTMIHARIAKVPKACGVVWN